MHSVTNTLRYFDSNYDTTMLEIRIWRETIFSLIEVHKEYAAQLLDAMKIMRDFLAEDVLQHKTADGQCSVTAMERLLHIVTRTVGLHTQIWNELCDTSKPYLQLTTWEEESYDQLRKKSADHWSKHIALEKLTETEKKCYQRQLEKWIPLHENLVQRMTKKEMTFNEKYATLTGKVEVALTKYQSHFRREAKHRQTLAEQLEEVKADFVRHEKERLDSLFDTLTELFSKMEKIVPSGIQGREDLHFSPGETDTEELATRGWESHLKSYTFPKYEGPVGTDPTEPSKPILVDRHKHYKINRKPVPTRQFSVVSMDNFLSADDTDTRNHVGRSKFQDSKSEIHGARDLLKKTTSTTSPTPVHLTDYEYDDDLATNTDLAGPNLEPMELDNNFSFSDSLKNYGLASEEEICKPMEKLTFFDDVRTGNKRSDVCVEKHINDGSQGISVPCPVEEGSWDVLQRLWDRNDDSTTKPEETESGSNLRFRHGLYTKQESSKSVNDNIKTERCSIDTEHKNSTITSEGIFVSPDSSKKGSCTDPVPSISDARRRHRNKENRKSSTSDIRDDIKHPSSHLSKSTVHKSYKSIHDCGASVSGKLKEKDEIKETLNSYVTGIQNQPSSCHEKPRLQKTLSSENNEKTKKKHYHFSGGSAEETTISKAFGPKERPKQHAKDVAAKSTEKQTAVETLSGPVGSEKNPVTVIVLKDRPRQNDNEISIRAGMKVKQTRGANEDGMAYGYKKTKLGLRKYGLYPAELVTLYNTRSDSSEVKNKD